MKSLKILALFISVIAVLLILAGCTKIQKSDIPYQPKLISPSNGSTLNSTSVTLSWSCSDPQNKPLNYTVYLDKGNSTPTTILATDIVASFYNINLSYNTTYFWRVVAKNTAGGIATSDVWEFKVGGPIPVTPYNPIPSNGKTNVSTSVQLQWSCYSPNGSLLNYTVYFGTSTNLSMATKTTNNHYKLYTLSASTTYYWKVDAQNLSGGIANGPIWHFTTAQKPALPPLPPNNPYPSNNATEIQPTNITLKWTDSDPQGYPLEYGVYLGKLNALTLVGTSATTSYNVGTISYGARYQWQIIAEDPYGNVATGTVWTFSTFDRPPKTPSLLAPSNFSTGVSAADLKFSWSCSDPDRNPLTYNLYLGTNSNPPLFKGDITTNSYKTNLKYNTTYHWKIVAIDSFGKTSTSVAWTFTTSNPPIKPPYPPSNPFPSNGAGAISLSPTLTWQCSDPQNYPLTYDIYFGTTQTPQLKSSDSTETSYTIPSKLSYSTKYYWYVVAKNSKGKSTKGPLWSFTTVSKPPAVASVPYPNNDQTEVSPDTQFSWYSDGQSGLTYDVYLATSSNSLSEIAQKRTSRMYTPALNSLQNNKKYYWQIVTHNSGGGTIKSPIWSFTTGANSSQGRITLDDQIVNSRTPFTLNVRGRGISNFMGMEIKLAFNSAKVAIDTSKGNNGVKLTGPIANATLMKPTVTSTMIDINLAMLGNAVNLPDNVCLYVYFTNKMTGGMTTIKTTYLDVRNVSNQQMDITYSDVGVVRVQ